MSLFLRITRPNAGLSTRIRISNNEPFFNIFDKKTKLNRAISAACGTEKQSPLSTSTNYKVKDKIDFEDGKYRALSTTCVAEKESIHNIDIGCSGNFVDGKPTIAYVKKFRFSYETMTNGDILHLSSQGDPVARQEALTRNIMAVENISHEDAKEILKEIVKVNRFYMHFHVVPYKLGLGFSLFLGLSSCFLVFQYDTVMYVHDVFVSADIPAPEDRESILEIGSWSWSWMEPCLGQISFVLLTLQFARSQLLNLGMQPYAGFVKSWRARKLQETFPNYSGLLLKNFVDSYTFSSGCEH